MNSVLQQLYMQPMLRHALLAVPESLEVEHASKQDTPDEQDLPAVEGGDKESKSGDSLENLVANATIKPLLNSDAELTKLDVQSQLKDSIVFHLQRIFANLQGLKQQVRHAFELGFPARLELNNPFSCSTTHPWHSGRRFVCGERLSTSIARMMQLPSFKTSLISQMNS
jgi:hypothetical protein